MIIYKIENKINGKIYVGQTIKALNKRISGHLISRYPIGNSLRKYGLQSFDISVIDKAETRSILSEKEKYWILFYACNIPNGYNLTDGGEGSVGYRHSKEALKKMSESHQGKKRGPHSEEHKRKIGLGNKGKIISLETREKISKAGKGRIQSIETRQKNSAAHKGKLFSQETRKKMSERTMGKSIPPEVREKIRNTLTGSSWSSAHKKAFNNTILKRRTVNV